MSKATSARPTDSRSLYWRPKSREESLTRQATIVEKLGDEVLAEENFGTVLDQNLSNAGRVIIRNSDRCKDLSLDHKAGLTGEVGVRHHHNAPLEPTDHVPYRGREIELVPATQLYHPIVVRLPSPVYRDGRTKVNRIIWLAVRIPRIN